MNISVITPVYNAELYLRKAVESALQFEEVKEVILIEDASPDNALQICRELVEEDKRVKLLQHPGGKNRGAGASRNLGIVNATQEYIAFLDADDFYLPNRFDRDKEILSQDKSIDGVYNALGVHFYSEKAREQYCATFDIKFEEAETRLSTVKPDLQGNSLFDSFWGIHYYHGQFNLDAFTVRRSSLLGLRGGLFKIGLKLHQDTELLSRVVYYLNLAPGDILNAVAKRGVHDDNRITNKQDAHKVADARYKMFSAVVKWANKEGLSEERKMYFLRRKLRFDMARDEGIKRVFNYLKYFFTVKGFRTRKEFRSTHTLVREDIKKMIRG